MAAFFGILAARFAVSPLVPDIRGAFTVSTGLVGLALTGLWAAYGVIQLPGGILAARYGERPVILAGIGLTAIGTGLLAFAPSFVLFAGAAILLGAAGGLYFPAATALLTRRFENTGQALGFHISGGDLSGLIAPVVAAYIAVRIGFRYGLALAGLFLIPIFLLCLLRLPATEPEQPNKPLREQVQPDLLAGLLTRPPLAYSAGLAVVLVFGFQVITSFFPTFLIEQHGFSTERASQVFGLVFAIIVVLLPIMGRASDRFGRDVILGGCLLALAVGTSLAIIASSHLVVLASAVIVGIGLSWGGALGSRIMDHLTLGEQSTGYGLIRTVYMLIASLGNVITGTLADLAGWPVAYGLLVGLLSIAFLSVMINHLFSLNL